MRLITTLAIMGLASIATAQPIETITFSVEWDKTHISKFDFNTGGVYATITPALGTMTAWNTAPGTGQAAILKAFASTIINLTNVKNGTEGALTWKVPDELNIPNKPGTPDGNGGVTSSQAGQFGPPANPNPVVTEKVKILDLKWQGQGGGFFGDVLYGVKGTSAKVYIDAGLAAWVGENAAKVDGQGGFQVLAPSPGWWGVIGLVGLAGARRKRQAC